MDKEVDRISVTKLVSVSALVGILVGIPKFCFTGFFFSIGVTHWFGLQDAGSIIFRDTHFPLDLFHLTLAAATYLLWGGCLSIVLGFIYLLTGKQNHILKGAYFGFIIWVIFRNFFASISLPQGLPPKDAITAAITMSSHLLWGAASGYFIVKYIPFKKEVFIKN